MTVECLHHESYVEDCSTATAQQAQNLRSPNFGEAVRVTLIRLLSVERRMEVETYNNIVQEWSIPA